MTSDSANQLGFVQGGTVATVLDGCLGIAGAVRSGGVLAMPLAEINVSFIRPTPVGTILARASRTTVPTPFPD